MKILRTVLGTILITIQAVFAVVIVGVVVTEADISGGGQGLAWPFAQPPQGSRA